MAVTGPVSKERSDGLLNELPAIGPAYQALYRSLWQQSHLPVQTLALCRLRLAQLHGDHAGVSHAARDMEPGLVQALPGWPDSDAITAAEKACLGFAEVYAMDAQAITDELADAVKAHHGDSGLVMLIEALGVFDGAARLARLWDLPGDWLEEAGA